MAQAMLNIKIDSDDKKSFEYFCGNDFQPEDSGDMPGTG